jgi:hypothetical protein
MITFPFSFVKTISSEPFINPPLTIGSAVTTVAQSPFVGGGNSYQFFEANADSYIDTPASSDWAVGTGDFTIEGWIYPTNTSSAYRAIVASENYAGTTGGWSLYQNGTSLEVWLTSGNLITATSAITASTWQHVALVRSGTGSINFKLYVN